MLGSLGCSSCVGRSGRQIHPAHICYESGLASDKSSAAAIYSAVQTCFAELLGSSSSHHRIVPCPSPNIVCHAQSQVGHRGAP